MSPSRTAYPKKPEKAPETVATPRTYCTLCSNSGWKMVEVQGKHGTEMRATRCECTQQKEKGEFVPPEFREMTVKDFKSRAAGDEHE